MQIDIPEKEFWFESRCAARIPDEAIRNAHLRKIDVKKIVEDDLSLNIRGSGYVPSRWDGVDRPRFPQNTFSISDVTITYSPTLSYNYDRYWNMTYTIRWPMSTAERDIYTEATRKRLERSVKARTAAQKSAESRKVRDREKILADIKKKAKRDPLLASALAEVISGGPE